MNKILLSAFISTALVGASFAAAPSPAFTGFYIGAAPTYTLGKLKGNSSINKNGAGINAFLGFGQVVQGGLYLGGEVSFGLDGSRFNSNKSGVTFKSKSRFTYNIAARLGYAFAEFLPFVKVGYEGRSKVTITEPGEPNISLNRNGLLLGLGGDYAVSKNVFIRGEYNYNFGSRKRVDGVSVKTPTQTFLIGAGYRF